MTKSANPPPRSDSLPGGLTSQQQLTSIQDELRDLKRVHSQGQEEDLKMALMKAITRVEELSAMLIEQYKAQTEIQTELTLCKSNLQLALANNEMLEDALKRDTSGRGKDLGWRRGRSNGGFEEDAASSHSLDVDRSSIDVPRPSQSPAPDQNTEGRFFKFRFGGRSPPQSVPVPVNTSPLNGSHPSHLSSASLSSLVPTRDKELDDLTSELERERKARQEIVAEKKKLEEELESLSQALFEEANNMVATERMKLADKEDELREVRDEKQAIRNALKLLEDENLRFREVLTSSAEVVRSTSTSRNHHRSNTLPQEERGRSAISDLPSRPSSVHSTRSILIASISSRSSSPEPTYTTPSVGPLDYDSGDFSPWAGEKSSSTFLQPPVAHSRVPPPLDIPPWSAVLMSSSPTLTQHSSLFPPSQKASLSPLTSEQLTVPEYLRTVSISSDPPLTAIPLSLSAHAAAAVGADEEGKEEAKSDIDTPQ